jgi:PST family polysaccharide transporter
MNKVFLKNVSFLTIIQISNTLLPLLIIPFLTRIISPELFGELEFARVFCYYFSILIIYGFDITTTRLISINRNNTSKINDIISQTTYAKILLFFFVSVFFVFSVNFFSKNDPGVKWLLFITYLINIGYTFYPIWYFQGTEKLKTITTISFGLRLVMFLILLLVIRNRSDFWIYNFVQSLSMIIIGFVSYFILYKKNSFKFTIINWKRVYKILKDGFGIFFSITLVTVITSLFFIVLKMYSNEIELGKFSVSNKLIATIQLLILLPFSQAFFPLISKQCHDDFILFKRNINRAAFYIFIITFVAGIIVYFYGDLIITIIFGSAYLNSYESLKIVAFLPMFASLNNIYSYQGLLSLKKDKTFIIIHVFYALLTLILCFAFSSSFSANTGSYIRITIECFLFLTSMFYYYKKIK